MVDVEQLVIDLLAPVVDPAKVSTRTAPGECVRVLRVGGANVLRVQDAALLVVEAWAGTESRAIELLGACRDYLLDVAPRVKSTGIWRTRETAGPANLPAPDTSQARYTLTVEVAVRRA